MFVGTVFAYGQTASGKTFTMKGSSESLGVIPLCIDQIYQEIEQVCECCNRYILHCIITVVRLIGGVARGKGIVRFSKITLH